MAIEIGTVNADTSVKLGTTTIQSGYIGFNKFYDTYTSILDLYPSAHHSYSLRKLKSTYTGFCLRVRRTTTTSTEVNVGFDVFNTISLNSPISYASGTATTAKTLGEFCASVVNGYGNPDGITANQSIFVVTWLDQSGNNKNTTQAIAGNQPRLVNSGNLELSDGKVSIRFISSSFNFLIINDTSVIYNNISSYAVGNPITTTSTNFLSLGNGTTNRFYLPNSLNISYVTGNTFSGLNIIAGVNNLIELICGTATTSAYKNGTIATPSSVASTTANNTFIRIGVTGASGLPLYTNGYISEVISFVGTPSRTGIESNINTYYSIY